MLLFIRGCYAQNWENLRSIAHVPSKAFKVTARYKTQLTKELQRVNRTKDPAEDQNSQLLSFSEILLEFCSINIIVKVYKNVNFTKFHSLL